MVKVYLKLHFIVDYHLIPVLESSLLVFPRLAALRLVGAVAGPGGLIRHECQADLLRYRSVYRNAA